MTLTISVCIPCIEEHINFLDRCVGSIYTQTFHPLEVVISISNITETAIGFPVTKNVVNQMMAKYRDRFNIVVFYTTERKYAGENRNITIDLSQGDIISFIDADDIMYSNRLNIISTIFRMYTGAVCILHYFTENALNDTEPDQTFSSDKISDYNFSELIHFGHPSFKRCIFDTYRYSSAPRTQDMELINALLPEYRDLMFIYQQQLTCYVSNDSTLFSKFRLC